MSIAEVVAPLDPPNVDEGHIFISYAHKDAVFARRLAKDLRRGGKKVWIDEDIEVGIQWRTEIANQVREAWALYLVLTPATEHSSFTMDEASRAQRNGAKIVPVMFRQCEIPL